MNRAQRRQAERNERRNITHGDRIVPLPALLDEFTVFDMPQSILDQISNGAIDAMQGVPVFRDNEGVWTEIIPALEGWILTWEMINEQLGLNINLLPLTIIKKRLHSNTPITRKNITAAQTCMIDCRKAFRSSKRQQIVSIAKKTQTKILIETKYDQIA